MPQPATRSRGVTFCGVLVYDGQDLPAFEKRLKNVFKSVSGARLNSRWLIACPGGSSPELEQNRTLRKLKARIFEMENGASDWPAFCLAASQAEADWLLLLPGNSQPSANELKEMAKASKKSQWVCRTGGPSPFWLRFFLDSLACSADLGSPCLVKRDFLKPLAALFNLKEALLGPRVFSLACDEENAVIVLPAAGGAEAGLARRFGLDSSRLSALAIHHGSWIASLAVFTCMGLVLSDDYVLLGLPLVGLSLVCLASFFGKPE